MITDIAGVEVGHWTDSDAMTGCTVVLLPPNTVASGEVRGGAPATREFAMLDPTNLVQHVDAVLLSGGSAFGLGAAEGVVDFLSDAGRGHPTDHGAVPIVVGMSLYDLGVGRADIRPGYGEGAKASHAAAGGKIATGLVGAGAGATVGKWSGSPTSGGIGVGTVRSGDVVVSALIAVNAFGSIDDGTCTEDLGPPVKPAIGQNTTIGVIVTNAVADKALCHLMAQSGHDGMARALRPAHTSVDGDALVAAATGQTDANSFHLRLMAQDAVTLAIRSVNS